MGAGSRRSQVFETLPVVKQLGFGWAVLDDGWQVALGDWRPRSDKFPAGDADMKALVDRIHAAGLKAQLWWAPMGADAGSRTEREHPEWLLRNVDGSTRKITWWDSQYLCPAVDGVREDAAAFARKALGEWGFDGLKIDGQHLNAAPECFNPAHAHVSPAAAPEGVPGFFKAIWDASQAVKPGAVIEICPCGTGYSYFTLPYLNMTVASDPESSWQIRSKGKTLKALAGDRIAYFGDHVEMSEGGEDFASTFGIGGVIGTNFAWPGAPGEKDRTLLLTPKREETWARWVKLYQAKRLSEGEYLGGLYDLGFDRPEAHVVRKGDALYFAFFAPRHAGPVELRGLAPNTRYAVRDYVNGIDLGTVEGPVGEAAGPLQAVAAAGSRAAAAGRLGLRIHVLPRDQARPALEHEVGPQPLGHDDDPVAQAHEEVHVCRAPDPPGDPALEAHPLVGDHGRLAADRREQAAVAIHERRRRRPAGDARAECARDVGALLLGDRRDPGLGRAVGIFRQRRVADDEDVGMPRRAKFRADGHAARAVGFDPEPARRRGRAHARRPDDGSGADEVGTDAHAIGVAVGHGLPEPHLDADAPQHLGRVARQRFRKVREQARTCLDQEHAGLRGIDRPEVARECAPRRVPRRRRRAPRLSARRRRSRS